MNTPEPGTETETPNVVDLDSPQLAQSLPDNGSASLADILVDHKPAVVEEKIADAPKKARKLKLVAKKAVKAEKPAKVVKAKAPKEKKPPRVAGVKAQGQVSKGTMAKMKRIAKDKESEFSTTAEIVREAVEAYVSRNSFAKYDLSK